MPIIGDILHAQWLADFLLRATGRICPDISAAKLGNKRFSKVVVVLDCLSFLFIVSNQKEQNQKRLYTIEI
jgi:hypothetical protein